MCLELKVDKYHKIDLAKCPHILIGGSTGSGKSYLMKNLLCDILETNEAKVLVLDPKSVDYKFLENERSLDSIGRGGKRKVRNVWTGRYESVDGTEYYKDRWLSRGLWLGDRDSIDSFEALDELKALCDEMYKRYGIMRQYGYVDWGEIMEDKRHWESSDKRRWESSDKRRWESSDKRHWEKDKESRDSVDGEEKEKESGIGEVLEAMENSNMSSFGTDRIVLMVDELADLIYWDRQKSMERLVGYKSMDLGEELEGKLDLELGVYSKVDSMEWKMLRGTIEGCLVKLSILGRAAGIHLILGTQRPDASILSGQLRANLPCRICLRVSSEMERRIILGQSGKEYGERSMLYQSVMYPLCWELS